MMDLNRGVTEDRTSVDLNDAITKASTNLNSKLEIQPKERSQPTIYRVHRHLREVKPCAYEPGVISIGPYHRGKDHLKMMEDHKLHTLQLLVERRGIEMEYVARAVGGVASEARKCYADQYFELSDSKFIEMLVLDGCFIIELLRKLVLQYPTEKDDLIFQMDWMICTLQRDLMLFENQVPFFVLPKLFNLFWPSKNHFDLVNLLSHFFSIFYPGSQFSSLEVELRSALQGNQEMMHLLDLIHPNWLPPKSQECEESKDAHPITIEKKEARVGRIERKETRVGRIELEKKDLKYMCCATRLTEANVKFELKKEARYFNIEFKDGTMGMPHLLIDDRTECLLRNLVVYEQYFKKPPYNLVSQYVKLLDSLINSSKDVEILSRNDIITNCQGDDEVVATMVNRLGDSITCGHDAYNKLFKDVNAHCKMPKNEWMAKLRRDYLNSPWAIISILVAVLLLLLTIVQTVCTILQVVQ